MPEPIHIEDRDGLYLPELDLWLDSRRKRARSFVSHGHADHFGRHDDIICSEATSHILRARYKVKHTRLSPRFFEEVWEEEGFRFTLLPAGHIFGSAMLHLTRLADGATLLYTGDFKTRSSLTAERPVFRPADTLVMETTFGKPEFVFPEDAIVHRMLRDFVKEALAEKATPVLLAYSLGKAQEAVAILHEAGLPCVVSGATAKMSQACRDAGMSLPPPEEFEDTVPAGHTLLCPPQALKQKSLQGLGNKRVAFLSGWALTPGILYRYRGIDCAIPLSDHADFPGLLEAVHRVAPKRIITIHGATRDFAAEMRRRGYEAWSIDGDDQLEFSLPF